MSDDLFPETVPTPKPRPRIGRPGEITPAVSLAVLEAKREHVEARTIEVIRADIEQAVPSALHSPTCWALRREYRLPASVKVCVWQGVAQIGETFYALPKEVCRAESWFLKMWDNAMQAGRRGVRDWKLPFSFKFEETAIVAEFPCDRGQNWQYWAHGQGPALYLRKPETPGDSWTLSKEGMETQFYPTEKLARTALPQFL